MSPSRSAFILTAFLLASCDAAQPGDAEDPAEEVGVSIATLALAASPGVALTSSANPSVFSERIVLSAVATIPGQPASSLTGSMTFSDGATALGTVTVTKGKGTLATRALASGSLSLSASFLQTGSTTPLVSAPLSQVVNAAATTTSITSSHQTANYGDAGSITARVKPTAPANAIPTGSADFFVDGGYYWTAPLDATGKAVLALADLYPAYYPGSYSVTATYSGDGEFTGSTTQTPLVQTLVGISAQPVSTVTLNAKSQPAFSPTSFSMSSVNPIGCNVTITNDTPNTLALLYGTPGSWKRLPGGAIAPGASGGFGVSIGNFTGYFTALGAVNFVAIHCR